MVRRLSRSRDDIDYHYIILVDRYIPILHLHLSLCRYLLTHPFTFPAERDQSMGVRAGSSATPADKTVKPTGYSRFPKDLIATPIHWVEKMDNLVWSKEHDKVSLALPATIRIG
jgi:hypothetical protein